MPPSSAPPAVRSAADHSPHARAERVIASARVGLAAFALAGVWIDPSDPETFANDTLHLLAVYCLYAVTYWILLKRGAGCSRRAALAGHLFDLAVAVVLVTMTQGAGSPFFLFFTFVLLCASVRWGARGAAWTGGTVVLAYATLGIVTWVWTLTADLEVNRFVLRLGLICMMTMILMQVGAFHERSYAELWQLARWPRAAHPSVDATLEEDLRYAARLLGVGDVALFWRDDDSADVQSARWRGGLFEHRAEPADDARPFPVLLTDARTLLYDGRGASPRVMVGGDAPRELPLAVFDPGLIERYRIRTALVAPLARRGHDGWLLFINGPDRLLSLDDMPMAEIVAAEISGSLERWRLTARARDAALAEERLRVARDLHDGVLQSMTGCRLGLAGIAGAAEGVLPDVAEQLRGVERALAHDQQELRSFIQHLRPPTSPPTASAAAPLRALCDRVQRQWGLAITLHPDSDAAVPLTLATQLLLLCHEALANVARHAAAASARVMVERRGADVVLLVTDDGRGFPFHGRYDAAQLAAMQVGPRTLRERAEELGGTLTLITTASGTTVEVRLPDPEVACA